MPISAYRRWLLYLVCLALPKLGAQSTPPYQPGLALRIDLEGAHRIVNRPPPAPPYVPGPVVRIDLEGAHKIVNRAPPVQPYVAGPVLRLDLEGSHRLKKS